MQAIVLAGGKGTRLRPYSAVIPKPLMPLGSHAVIEIVLHQLQRAGFSEVIISLGHLGELIEAYVSRIELPRMKISYVREKAPLGTAGPLSLVDKLDERFLVMNGDILTDLNFEEMYRLSSDRKDDITVAVFPRKLTIHLGVLQLGDDDSVLNYTEKPEYPYLASMGVYMMRRCIVSDLPRGVRKDLPEFVLESLRNKLAVRAYRFNGFWLDIGRIDDYQEAQDSLSGIMGKLGLSYLLNGES